MNPQGHKGKFFELQQAPQGMSSLRGLAGKHGNRRFDVVNLCFAAPFRYLLPFLLDKKGPKNQGRHQGPTAQSRRPSPMSAGPPRPARTRLGIPTREIFCLASHPLPLRVIARMLLSLSKYEAIQTSSRLRKACHPNKILAKAWK